MNRLFSYSIRFPIGAKIFTGFSSLLVIIAVLVAIEYREMNLASDIADKILPYSHEMSLLTDFSQSVDALETAVDTFFVTPYMQYSAIADSNINRMFSLVSQLKEKRCEKQQELRVLDNSLTELKRVASAIFAKFTNNIDKKNSTNRVTNYEISKLYKSISAIKQQIQDLLLDHTKMLQNSIIEQNHHLQTKVSRFIVVFVIVFVIAIVASLIISRSISRPIKRLKDGATAFAKGEEDIKVAVTSNDEIGDLTQAFNRGAKTLVLQRERLSRSKKMETLGLLAGGVAHDLNNVLAGVVGYPDLLLMGMAEDDPKRRGILAIKKSGEKSAAIVEDLLTLARRGVPVNEVVNLNDIACDYLSSLEYGKLIEHNPGVDVRKALDKGLDNIVGSPVHLKKTIMNLVSNAAEAQPKGGRVTISTQNRFLDKPLEGYDSVEKGNYAVLTIQDWGMGIASEDLDRIFEPFYTKKTMRRSGTGLGMPIVWGAVEDHHGYIQVSSTVGEGTLIELYFPITKDPVAEKTKNIPLEKLLGNNEQILVVDDLGTHRKLARNILEKLNYSVKTVSSGEAALDYLKTRAVDLVILDMMMGEGIDGCETYERIVQVHPGQKAIIASGFAETGRFKRAKELGVGHFLKKPYQFEEIGLAVRNLLSA